MKAPAAGDTRAAELTDEDLRVLRAALEAYLEDFGHEEADVTRRIREVMAKLPDGSEGGDVR